jgi:hypothetical protein
VLESLPLLANSDDFVFDNEMLTQAIAAGFRVGEISCPTKYFAEASSISFRRSVKYGFGVLRVSLLYRLAKWGLVESRIFSRSPTFRLGSYYESAIPAAELSTAAAAASGAERASAEAAGSATPSDSASRAC